MKRIPKLILCDVDGTLIDRSEKITPAFDVLEELIRTHHLHFSIASGRCAELVEMYVQKLGIQDPILINNGAGARQNGQVLWDELFDARYVKEAVHEADRLDMAVFMCHGDYELAYRHNAYIQREIDVFGRYNRFHIPLDSEWETMQLERVMLTDPCKPGRVDQLMEYLTPYSEHLRIIRYDDRHIDVMKKGVSKGAALDRLVQTMGITLEDVMFIGDGLNDMEIVKAAGIGVAVGNANPELKAAADYVCSGCNTDGVIEAVRRFCV